MSINFVKSGEHLVNLSTIAAMHWEGSKLFIHLEGGRFLSMVGPEARRIWNAVMAQSDDLDNGEEKQKA